MTSTASPDQRQRSRPQTAQEEHWNAASHGIGCLAAITVSPFLILQALTYNDMQYTLGILIFCSSMILLYGTSGYYHFVNPGNHKQNLATLDHACIFVFIAGCYTPFTLGVLRGNLGWTLLAAVWTLASIGVVLKVVYKTQYPKLSNTAYLLMGWLIVFAAKPFVALVPLAGVIWLAVGGLAYTLGVIFYVLDSRFHYCHLIWHIFVLIGTMCHVIAVYWYAF